MRRLAFLLALLSVLTLAFLASSAAAAPNWITTCGFSHTAMDDPIVFPGQPGASHDHTFLGGDVDAFSTFASLLKGPTTCLMPGDHSGYWAPTPNYPVSDRGGLLVYYRTDGAVPFPDGLKMIVGNSHATSEAGNAAIQAGHILFKCGPGSNPETKSPPKSCSSGILSIDVMFPEWWDGKNLDSPDHISHVSYTRDATHTVQIPRMKWYLRLAVPAGKPINLSFSSGPYYTAHVDFFDGWVRSDLQKFINQCASKACGTNPG